MNFIDTIMELREQTKAIEVIAAGCYSNHKPDIGIRRRTYYDETLIDPIVDDIPFMICGDIYTKDHERMTEISDVKEADTHDLYVRLRAIPGYDPWTTIELGRYRVKAVYDVYGDNVIKLELYRFCK